MHRFLLFILLIAPNFLSAQCYMTNTICPTAFITRVMGSGDGYSPDGKYCEYQVSLQTAVTFNEPVTKLIYTLTAGGESVDICYYGDNYGTTPGVPSGFPKDCNTGAPYSQIRWFSEDIAMPGMYEQINSAGSIEPELPTSLILPCSDNLSITDNESNQSDGSLRGAPCTATFVKPVAPIGGLGPTNLSIYPIELVSFNGVSNSTFNTISWETGLENGFSHFNLQYSSNASEFFNVARIEKNEIGVYSFDHHNPSIYNSYYRLEMVDLDGSKEISKIISIAKDGSAELTVFPNPTSEIINVAAPEKIQSILLKDGYGRVVNTSSRTKGYNSIVRLPEQVNPGLYSLMIHYGNKIGFKKVMLK